MLDHLYSGNLIGIGGNVPIFLEPDQSFLVVLASDKDKPIESRPVFRVKSQSMRHQRRLLEVIDIIHKDGVTVDEIFDATIEQLKRVVCGWSNMGQPFSVDALDELLTFSEARELLSLCAYNQRMDDSEKKD
jgi:hypothetical protein